MKNLRWPILLLIPLVLATLIFLELADDDESLTSSSRSGDLAFEDFGPSWFCPVLDEDRKLEIFNPGEFEATADITIYSAILLPDSDTSTSYLTDNFDVPIAALENRVINMEELFVDAVQKAKPDEVSLISQRLERSEVFLSALVEFSEPGPVPDISLCSNQASNKWYIPFASTARDACYYLAIFNPFTTAAVLDLEFATDGGKRTPYEGTVVPAGTSLFLNVGSTVTRRNHISTALTTRSGQVVVAKYLTFTGKPDAFQRLCPEAPYDFLIGEETKLWGTQVELGAPTGSKTWYFPAGINPLAGGSYSVYNPDTENSVEVDLRLTPNIGSVVNIAFSVPAGQRTSVQITEGELHPLPEFPAPILTPGFETPGIGHWALFESESEIVVERLQTGANIREGIIGSLGITRAETQIPLYKNLLTFGRESSSGVYIIVNPSMETIARVSIPGIIGESEIGPGRRFLLAIPESSLRGDEVLLSTTPVVAEAG